MKRWYLRLQLYFISLWILCNESYDYRIQTTYSFNSPDYRSTDILVVVYNPIVSKQKVSRILEDFTVMNGRPDALTLIIYWGDVKGGREIVRINVVWEDVI